MIGVNWDAIGGEAIPLQSLFSADDLAKMKTGTRQLASKDAADQIMFWDTDANNGQGGYSTYFLFKTAQGVMQGWATYADGTVDKTKTIPAGTGVWFFRQGDTEISVNIAGEVSDSASFSHPIKGSGSYNLIAAGYPRTIYLNSDEFAYSVGTTGTRQLASKDAADQIMVYDPEANNGQGGYTSYFLFKTAQGVMQGWAEYSSGNVVKDLEIPAGGAAWYYRKTVGDISVSESNPVPAN